MFIIENIYNWPNGLAPDILNWPDVQLTGHGPAVKSTPVCGGIKLVGIVYSINTKVCTTGHSKH